MRIALLVLVAALAIPFAPSVAWSQALREPDIYGCSYKVVRSVRYDAIGKTQHWVNVAVQAQNTNAVTHRGTYKVQIGLQWGDYYEVLAVSYFDLRMDVRPGTSTYSVTEHLMEQSWSVSLHCYYRSGCQWVPNSPTGNYTGEIPARSTCRLVKSN